MNQRLRFLIGCAVLLYALLPISAGGSEHNVKKVYLALWRGCEAACRGFQEELGIGGSPPEIIVRNADRDKSRLAGFVEEARALKADVVVTWGTSVTLGMVGTIGDRNNPAVLNDIPVVFMIVADPIASGIVESYESSGRPNVTGTRNRVPEKVNIATIRKYRPGFRKLGLLYNRDEPNSVLKMEELRALSESMGFELVALEIELDPQGKPRPESIPEKLAALEDAAVDFMYFGSSSFLRVNSDLFTRSAVEHGLPLLSPYEKLVRESQALISVAAPYADVGRLAARQVEKILADGRLPGDLPVASLDKFSYVINMRVAAALNLFPPIELLQFAETVN